MMTSAFSPHRVHLLPFSLLETPSILGHLTSSIFGDHHIVSFRWEVLTGIFSYEPIHLKNEVSKTALG